MKHYRPEEVADLLQVSVVTVRRRAAAGQIPGATRAAGCWRIPEQGLHEWLASGQAKIREPIGVANPQLSGRLTTQRRRFRLMVGKEAT